MNVGAIALGKKCYSDSNCPSMQYCPDSPGRRYCQRYRGPGQVCGGQSNQRCAKGLTCLYGRCQEDQCAQVGHVRHVRYLYLSRVACWTTSEHARIFTMHELNLHLLCRFLTMIVSAASRRAASSAAVSASVPAKGIPPALRTRCIV
jgi:hypothetical protein